jgi:hypothetical protein
VTVIHTASFIVLVQVLPFCVLLLCGSSVLIWKSCFDVKEFFFAVFWVSQV